MLSTLTVIELESATGGAPVSKTYLDLVQAARDAATLADLGFVSKGLARQRMKALGEKAASQLRTELPPE
jgi:hypothetical protein